MAVVRDHAGVAGGHLANAGRVGQQPGQRRWATDLHRCPHLHQPGRVADGLDGVAVALFRPQENRLATQVVAIPERGGVIELRGVSVGEFPAPLVVVPGVGKFTAQRPHPEPTPVASALSVFNSVAG